MDDKDKLQQQMAEIGTRYLRRTLGELPQLHALLARLRATADVATFQELEQMTHKIHGSGAMFGFEVVSERARDVELLAASRVSDAQTMQRIEECIARLEQDVRATARARGIE